MTKDIHARKQCINLEENVQKTFIFINIYRYMGYICQCLHISPLLNMRE